MSAAELTGDIGGQAVITARSVRLLERLGIGACSQTRRQRRRPDASGFAALPVTHFSGGKTPLPTRTPHAPRPAGAAGAHCAEDYLRCHTSTLSSSLPMHAGKLC